LAPHALLKSLAPLSGVHSSAFILSQTERYWWQPFLLIASQVPGNQQKCWCMIQNISRLQALLAHSGYLLDKKRTNNSKMNILCALLLILRSNLEIAFSR
jgi:hypothetical protein